MMVRRADARRDAPALRFLLGCVGGWICLRVIMVWNPAMPSAPVAAPAPWAAPAPFARTDAFPVIAPRAERPPIPAIQHRSAIRQALPVPLRAASGGPSATAGVATRRGIGTERHDLRLALIARLLPSQAGSGHLTAAAVRAPFWLPPAAAARADVAQGEAFWMRRELAGWSAAAWLYLREGSGEALSGIGAASQLGGSQAGVRLGYGFGATGRLRAYARATMAAQRPQQREAAFGLAFAPLVQLPIDVAIEQRVAAGREGRTALAAMASGGVSDVALPAGFRLDAYVQAGVVGARRRDGFADGAVMIDRRLGRDEASLRLGALAAGAVQPGAARVDVGPRLTLRLPDVGQGGRIALDWRQRIAGDARPESGLALTLAADF